MNRWKRLFFYILLNIIVSTITILGVLFFWENTSLKEALTLSEETASQSDPVGEKLESASESQETASVVKIIEVTGVNNLSTERLLLKRIDGDSNQAISLLHWRLRDENGHEIDISAYSNLQSLELYSPGAIEIYTKKGESIAVKLFLGLNEPLWVHGETVTLLDDKGEIQDTFLIP